MKFASAVPIAERDRLVLKQAGLPETTKVYLNLPAEALVEKALLNGEGVLANTKALMCDTGVFTGRSPKDKYIVRDEMTAETVWWGSVNHPLEESHFETLHQDMLTFLDEKTVYVRYAQACALAEEQVSVCIITTQAWHNLFCHHLFIRPDQKAIAQFSPEWTILNIPEFKADPAVHGTRSSNFTIIDFSRKIVLIGGTGYAGEMKKGIFSVLNYTLPQKGILSMHCSANVGEKGDTALFFGLSGTGKTTLSADPNRQLIGDDEHGWAKEKVFNIEGGCYAKVIDLTQEKEPEIFGAIRENSILENTRFFPGTKEVNYEDNSVTDNTRTAYPLPFIDNALIPSVGNSPQHIFFLTADAFGVLPPISRLTTEQAMYYFISGFTSKLAGTEVGVKEPQPTFSACFGAAFLPLHPSRYATLLGEKLQQNQVNVWLINTGWVGGSYGVGERIKLRYTRAMITAAMQGELDQVAFQSFAPFHLSIPLECPHVPSELLNPRENWSDPIAYDHQARLLAQAFQENYQQYQSDTTPAITQAGPILD
ncbi:phosphoenolpyruvate carboxykinase (ATP) [Siphonobacter sp. SORGH_AS_0500]|uniref:phosphoenolpyruvate carboxykinase (ATP) n=1 Tax=Siphonobacter sp. SORGH_AS_0500 TaxID=1864824 RepID=UPI00285780D7|nr:phosphoenolpyruvate carboxykinase (ATP) [Siphonobacter sp. SORGH_AS_0500]MDR6194502.1 phosphoenolpyruvate carboxykinase (ATP) [Siphonobacter sp. SORGH_AS_0500]